MCVCVQFLERQLDETKYLQSTLHSPLPSQQIVVIAASTNLLQAALLYRLQQLHVLIAKYIRQTLWTNM